MSATAEFLSQNGEQKYSLKLTPEGIFLEIFPCQEDQLAASSERILEQAHRLGLPANKDTAIIQMLRESSGKSQKICTSGEVMSRDSTIEMQISEDNMSCYITITESIGYGNGIAEADLKKYLEEQGITFGLKEDVIKSIFEKGGYCQSEMVASGSPVVDGKDGYLEYHFDWENRNKPLINEDGKADFFNLNLIIEAKEGAELVTVHPPVVGENGMNVKGRQITSKAGKRVVPPMGKNVFLSEDGTKILSKVEGEVVIEKKAVSVYPVHTVITDVGPATGNIEFSGSVIVKGSLNDGYSINAGGNVELTGQVTGGTIKAGGDVIAMQGIQAQATVHSGGRIMTKFIENSVLVAATDIDGGEAIIQCDISAGGQVIALNRKGVIVGGSVRAGRLVNCVVVGSDMGTMTTIEIGVNPLAREEYKEIMQNFPLKQKDLDKTQKAINLLRQMESSGAQLSQDKKDMLVNLTKTRFQLMGELERFKKRKEELEVELENTRQGKLRARDFVYPGVRLTIGKAKYYNQDTLQCCELALDAGEIRVRGY